MLVLCYKYANLYYPTISRKLQSLGCLDDKTYIYAQKSYQMNAKHKRYQIYEVNTCLCGLGGVFFSGVNWF